MDAILPKIKADVTSRPLITLLILVTIIAASTLLTLALATLMNLSGPYDKSFAELNGAHLWLYFNRERIRARDIEWIESLPEVAASTGVQYSVQSRVRIHDTRVLSSLRVMPEEQPAVNRLLLQQGRYLAPRRFELLANEDFNFFYQISLDESVGVTGADGKEIYLPVSGFTYNPMWDTYRSVQPPYLYLSEKTLRELFPDESTWEWSLGLRLADPEAVDQVLNQIKEKLRSEAVEAHTDWRDVRTSAIFEAQLNFVFLGAFSFFAILATILVVASSISAIVLAQFKQIGMLKAIGFTQNQILWLYLGQYLFLSLIGSLCGLGLGILLAPLALDSVAVSLNTTFQSPLNFMLAALVFSIVPGVVVLACLGAAYRGARANIIKAIAIGAEAPQPKLATGTQWAAQLGLPILMVLGFNDLLARPFRSFLTGLNLTIGVMGVVFGLAINETLEAYMADPSLLGIVYDAIVTRDETGDSRTQHLLRTAPGVEAFYGEQLVDAETLGGQSFQIRAVEGNVAAFPIKIAEGRFFQPDAYEAIAGQGLLDWLGLQVGDELTLTLEDKEHKPLTWRIVGRYAEPSNAGQMLMLGLPTATRAVKHLSPTTYYLKLSPAANVTQLKHHLQPGREADLTLTLVDKIIPWSVLYLQVGLFGLAVILIGMALVNVFNTSLLAVQEKLRAVGVLKTLGMTPGQVVTMVNTSTGFLGLLATLAGIPLGLVFTKGILTSLAQAYGIGEVNVTLNYLYVLLLIPLMVAVSMIGSLIPARQAANVSIVRVLRNE